MEESCKPPPWCTDDDAEFFSEDEGTQQCVVMQGLRDLYFTETLCDVTIVTEGRRFLCHRVVLASVSPYFRAMFTSCIVESQQGEVSLLDVSASIIETILHFIYTGEAAVTLDNAEDLFTVSSRLQITAMQEQCSRPTMEESCKPPPWCTDDDAEFSSEDEGTLKCAVIQGLRDLYFTETLCDVTIVTEGRRFLCHRVVLASVSPYFLAMFTTCMVESQQGEVSLLDVSASIIETILHFIYTGEAAVTLDNVEDLFTVSGRLQITAMQEQCSRFLIKRLNNDNCFWTYRLASTHYHSRLLEMAMKYISWHITSLSDHEDLLHLEQGEIIKILSSDQLMVSSELSVYHMALSWWKANSSEDSPLPVELRRVIRLQLMLPHERQEVEKGGSWEECDLQELTPFRLRQGMFENWIVCMGYQERDQMFFDDDDDDDNDDDDDDDDNDFFMQAYDPATNKWNRLMPLRSVSYAECVAVGSYLYVTGGEMLDNSISKTFHVYDSMTNDWTELPSMMSPRDMHGFLYFDEKLYAVGGRTRDGVLDSMECFDLSKHCWSELSKLPYPLCSFLSAQLKGKLYIIGGETTQYNRSEGLLIYHIASDMWSLIPNKISVRYGGAVTMDNKVFVIGGYDYSSVGQILPTERSFVLDEKGRVCEDLIVPQLLEDFTSAGVTRWGERIYVFGTKVDWLDNNINYWTLGDSRWTHCGQELSHSPDFPAWFVCATLQVPLRKLFHLIPSRSAFD
ncbi:kelch repeat and BTB domain-containing protein 8-like [Hyperolius riggenbachi]|uniref:kelch repeat and BTB domain-containing protein 8-like n=1 Tax=Hyperolius riggenbachi TaxID=752182 RepID=UPI0035A33CCD